MNKKTKKITGIVLVLALVLTLALSSIRLFAVGIVPPMEGDSVHLQIAMRYDESTSIEGATLSIYQVATVEVNEEAGTADYQAVDRFSGVTVNGEAIDYNKLDTDSSLEAAAELAKAALDLTADGVAATNENGIADFGNITSFGMYLVMQTGRNLDKNAANYKPIDPYILMIPGYDTYGEEKENAGDYYWVYETDENTHVYMSRPKTSIIPAEMISLQLHKTVDALPAPLQDGSEGPVFTFVVTAVDTQSGEVLYSRELSLKQIAMATDSELTFIPVGDGGVTVTVEEKITPGLGYEPANANDVVQSKALTAEQIGNGNRSLEFTFSNILTEPPTTTVAVNRFTYNGETIEYSGRLD